MKCERLRTICTAPSSLMLCASLRPTLVPGPAELSSATAASRSLRPVFWGAAPALLLSRSLVLSMESLRPCTQPLTSLSVITHRETWGTAHERTRVTHSAVQHHRMHTCSHACNPVLTVSLNRQSRAVVRSAQWPRRQQCHPPRPAAACGPAPSQRLPQLLVHPLFTLNPGNSATLLVLLQLAALHHHSACLSSLCLSVSCMPHVPYRALCTAKRCTRFHTHPLFKPIPTVSLEAER